MLENRVIAITRAGRSMPAASAPSLVLSSVGADWQDLVIEQHRFPPPDDTAEHSHPSHALTLHLGSPAKLEWFARGQLQARILTPGEITLTPSGLFHQPIWRDEVELLAVSISPSLVARVAYETVNPDRIELMEKIGGPDPQIYHIGLALRADLKAGGGGGALYAETLATALAIHLLRQYNGFPLRLRQEIGGLSPAKLRRAIDFIHDNLDREVTLTQIADAVGLSPSYFHSQFKKSIGLPPHQYVVQQRVEWARKLLGRGDLSIGEVATRVGFYDQGHLSRHMHRLLGVTPSMLLLKNLPQGKKQNVRNKFEHPR